MTAGIARMRTGPARLWCQLALPCMLALAVALLPGCKSEPDPDPDAPRLTLIQVSSLSGATTYGVVFEIGREEVLRDVEVSVKLPDGVNGEPSSAPAGASFAGVSSGLAKWSLGAVSGPAVVGPFVFDPAGDAGAPEGAGLKWSGGSTKTSEAKVRKAGVALGEGVLRASPTTSVILIGRETEITGYAVGASLNVPRAILVTRDPVDVGALVPDMPEVLVASSHFRVEPASETPMLMELTAPRPLPPYAPLSIETAGDDGQFVRQKYTGRVGPMGDRIFIPITTTGKYRALIDSAWYARANSPMSPDVLAVRQSITGRASQVAFEIRPEFVPALAEVDSDEASELLAIERALPSTQIPASIPEGLSFNGLAVCSTIACIGANAPNGTMTFCDLVHDITACLPIDRPGEEVTVTVTGKDPLFNYCQERACYVPGYGISDGTKVPAEGTKPVSMMVSAKEIIWIGSPVAA